MKSDKKCLGCGTNLSLDPSDKGFVKNYEMDYCMSCYRLKHYRQVTSHHHPNFIPKIASNSLVLVVSSVLYLDLVFTYPVKRYAPDSKIVYLINQLDLLPHQTNYNYLMRRLKKEANLYHVEYEDILLLSANSKADINKLKQYLDTYLVDDIYLLGVQNSGKTTIFNHLTNQNNLLTDVKAGLTQEEVVAKIGKTTIHDLPGLYQKGYVHELMEYRDYSKLIPLNEFKPINYQVKNNSSFMIDNMITITYLKGVIAPIVFYFNNLDINRVNYEKIDQLLNQLFEYTISIFKLEKNIKYQITIADMGLIHLIGPATIEIKTPKGMHLSLREAFFI